MREEQKKTVDSCYCWYFLDTKLKHDDVQAIAKKFVNSLKEPQKELIAKISFASYDTWCALRFFVKNANERVELAIRGLNFLKTLKPPVEIFTARD